MTACAASQQPSAVCLEQTTTHSTLSMAGPCTRTGTRPLVPPRGGAAAQTRARRAGSRAAIVSPSARTRVRCTAGSTIRRSARRAEGSAHELFAERVGVCSPHGQHDRRAVWQMIAKCSRLRASRFLCSAVAVNGCERLVLRTKITRRLACPRMVPLLLGQATIDNEPHARDRDRGFGNVGREDDLAFVRRRRDERLGLLDGRQFGVEGQNGDLFPCVRRVSIWVFSRRTVRARPLT